MKSFSEFLAELSVPLGDTGKRVNVRTNTAVIRMADGTLKRKPVGKSGSSGGGGGSGDGGGD